MILESIVTTVSPDGSVNIAPMGPIVADLYSDSPQFLLRPFAGSRTHQNLCETRRAAIHVTDDARLIAQSAVGEIANAENLVRSIENGRWQILVDCHRWFAVEVAAINGESNRCEMPCRVISTGTVRPFFGFNRAKHAVIEAAILATRTHLHSAEFIKDEMDRLTPLIDKTAGPDEHEAFRFLQQAIDERLERHR